MVWNAIAGIAGAAASLFGGDDDDNVQRTESSVNYKQMVKSAQKAGINPLTALRNGGAAGFSRTTTTTPALASESLLGRIAQATGLVAEGLSNQQRWERSEHRENLENQLILAQIDDLRNRGTGSSARGGGSPRLGGTTPPAGQQPGEGTLDGDGSHVRKDVPADVRQTPRTHTNIFGPDNIYETDPNTQDGEMVQRRYGESELAETLTFLYTAGKDYFHNWKKANQRIFDRWVEPLLPEEGTGRRSGRNKRRNPPVETFDWFEFNTNPGPRTNRRRN